MWKGYVVSNLRGLWSILRCYLRILMCWPQDHFEYLSMMFLKALAKSRSILPVVFLDHETSKIWILCVIQEKIFTKNEKPTMGCILVLAWLSSMALCAEDSREISAIFSLTLKKYPKTLCIENEISISVKWSLQFFFWEIVEQNKIVSFFDELQCLSIVVRNTEALSEAKEQKNEVEEQQCEAGVAVTQYCHRNRWQEGGKSLKIGFHQCHLKFTLGMQNEGNWHESQIDSLQPS